MIGILTQKILSLAIIMVMGAMLVRFHVLRSEDSKVLSTMSLYLIMPCMILNAFQVNYTEEVKNGLILVFFAAAVNLALLIVSGALLKKWLHLDAVEQTSFVYSNAGNLIIPLVTAMLGKECFELLEVRQVNICDADILITMIEFWHGGMCAPVMLTGAAVQHDDAVSSVVRSTLDGLNRCIGKLCAQCNP